MKKKVAAAVLAALSLGGALYFLVKADGGRVVVAVVDTGIELDEIDAGLVHQNRREIADNDQDDDGNGYVDDVHGWDFVLESGDMADEAGHGTKVALEILETCRGDCRVLPLRVTQRGAGARARDLVQAIRYAIGQGARVIHFSLGVLPDEEQADELKSAIEAAAAKRILIVAAAGVGIRNPFRPMTLREIQPQADPRVLVVGVMPVATKPDPVMNGGPELDVVVIRDPMDNLRYGTSYAAAEVSGWAATMFARRGKKVTPEEIRHWIRASAKPARIVALDELDRVGFGVVTPKDGELPPAVKELDYQVYFLDQSKATRVLISAPYELGEARAKWRCEGQEKFRVSVRAKGVVEINLKGGTGQPCPIQVNLESADGSHKKSLEINWASR